MASKHRMKAMDHLVPLACPECKRQNYTTSKNKKSQAFSDPSGRTKLELSKYCFRKSCRKHTVHKEVKRK